MSEPTGLDVAPMVLAAVAASDRVAGALAVAAKAQRRGLPPGAIHDLLRDAADLLRDEQPGLDVPAPILGAMLAGLVQWLASRPDFPDGSTQ